MSGERMTPDEENWASWKCGGGPHIDWAAYNNPNNVWIVQTVATVIPVEEPQVRSDEAS